MRSLLRFGLVVACLVAPVVSGCQKKPGPGKAKTGRTSGSNMDETTEMEPPPEPIKTVGMKPGEGKRPVERLRQACQSGDRAACAELQKLGVKP